MEYIVKDDDSYSEEKNKHKKEFFEYPKERIHFVEHAERSVQVILSYLKDIKSKPNESVIAFRCIGSSIAEFHGSYQAMLKDFHNRGGSDQPHIEWLQKRIIKLENEILLCRGNIEALGGIPKPNAFMVAYEALSIIANEDTGYLGENEKSDIAKNALKIIRKMTIS